MTDTPRGYHRDVRGRFARPVPGVNAKSKFGPMGADIPFDDVSGAPSGGTIEHPRHAPDADNLAQGGQSSPRTRPAARDGPPRRRRPPDLRQAGGQSQDCRAQFRAT